jgi:tetratricopeptide (TPR) repeat protein
MIWLVALLLAAPPSPAPAAVKWQTDWNTAFKMAKEQHKLVFVDYYQNRCEPCQDVEHLVIPSETVQKELSDFVLLKLDLDRSAIPLAHRYAPPAYVIFDANERERFRIDGEHVLRADDWHQQWDVKNNINYPFYGPLDAFRATAPAFVKAAELFEAKRDLDAHFLVARAYNHLKMPEHARAAFAEAKKAADKSGNAAAAQLADAQSAYTYVIDGRADHAVELLRLLTHAPADQDTAALIWLTLGHAYEAGDDRPDAVDAFRRAQLLAKSGSRTSKEAIAALAHVQ